MTEPYPQGQWDAGTAAPPPKPKNGMGVAALVLGILALLSLIVIGWIPFVGIVSVVLGLIAVVLGVVGRGRVKRQQATNRGAATTGLVLGVLVFVIALILQILGIIIGVAFLNSGGAESIQQFQDCVSQANSQGTPIQRQQALQQCADQFGQQLPNLGGGGQ